MSLLCAGVMALVAGCGFVTAADPDAGRDVDAEAAEPDATSRTSDSGAGLADAGVTFPDDAVLYIPFEDQSFDDASESGHDVSSAFAEPAFATDRFGFGEQALDFTENFGNTYDMALASEPLGLTGELTVAVWIQGQSFGNGERIAGQGEWFALMFESSDSVRFGMTEGIDAAAPGVSDPGTHDDEAWIFYAGVVDVLDEGDTAIELYRDGQLVADDTADGTFSPAEDCSFYVGSFNGGGDQCNGLDEPARLTAFVDDVRVYDRALSAAEIQLLYEEGGWPDE